MSVQKMILILAAVFLFILFIIPKGDRTGGGGPEDLSGTISVSGAWALYPMVVRWSQAFQETYPDIHFDITAGGAGKGMADALGQMVDLGMVSRDIYEVEIEKGAWWVSVTKDAVVPTVNQDNPMIETLLTSGLTKQNFVDIYIHKTITRWGQVAGREQGPEIHVFTRSDACGAAQTWAKYLGSDQEDLLGVGVYGDPGLAEAVVKDVLGIGYNNINFAFDAQTGKPFQGLNILPIDLNENHKIDANESFYETRDALVEAIASGRYPAPPARDLHIVCAGEPTRKVVRVFLQWVLNEGQAYMEEAGYIALSPDRLAQERGKVLDTPR